LLLNNDGRIALPPFGCTIIEVYLYLNGVRPDVWYLDQRLTDRKFPLGDTPQLAFIGLNRLVSRA
jgi:hypothetical protein